ncbi:MAG TPA: LirA/MavJ family T4SS effector, partial [Myxococcota bacterium]|nr:LirA/MavJ family T4SS effector [Myxococcota bacterium]
RARRLTLSVLMHPGHNGGQAALPRVTPPLSQEGLAALLRRLEGIEATADARLAARHGLTKPDLTQLQRRRQRMVRQLVPTFAPTQMGRLTLPDDAKPSALTLDAKREAVAVYEGVRRFVQDPLRVLRCLQGLEAEVLQRHRQARVPLETAFMQILEAAEIAAGLGPAVPVTGGLDGQPFHKMLRDGHPFDDIIFFSQPHGSKTHRLQNLLVMREMREDPAAFGARVNNWGAFYKILGNRVLRRELGFPRGTQQEDLWRMLFDALHTSNFGCADAVKSIAREHAPWLGDIEHTPLALATADAAETAS